VKNRIYTLLLLGISVAFSVTGYTQTKPASKKTPKTISAPTLHSNHTKPDNKKNSTKAVNAKLSNKTAPVTPKSANKKNLIATTKLTTQRKSVAAPKFTAKKQPIVSAKLKNNKKSIASSKSSHQADDAVTLDPAARKHSVISSKSIESVSIKHLNDKKLQKHTRANLNLDNAESDQSIQTNNDKQFHRILIDHRQTTKINTAHVSIDTSFFLDGLEADLS